MVAVVPVGDCFGQVVGVWRWIPSMLSERIFVPVVNDVLGSLWDRPGCLGVHDVQVLALQYFDVGLAVTIWGVHICNWAYLAAMDGKCRCVSVSPSLELHCTVLVIVRCV